MSSSFFFSFYVLFKKLKWKIKVKKKFIQITPTFRTFPEPIRPEWWWWWSADNQKKDYANVKEKNWESRITKQQQKVLVLYFESEKRKKSRVNPIFFLLLLMIMMILLVMMMAWCDDHHHENEKKNSTYRMKFLCPNSIERERERDEEKFEKKVLRHTER